MKTRNSSNSQWVRHMSRLLIAVIAFMSVAGSASARILFQDDDFDDVASEGIIINFDDGGDEDVTLQFGNDSSDATMTFDDGTGDVTFDTPGADFFFGSDNITTTGATSTDDLTATGTVNFSGADAFRIRENLDPATNSACTTVGELIMDTTSNDLQMCTATGVAGAATWVDVDTDSGVDGGDAQTLDTLDSLDFLRSNTSDSYTSGTLDFDSGTTLLTDSGSTVDINGELDASGATEFHIREVADEASATCTTVGELVLDTAENRIYVCTVTGIGAASTWVASDAGSSQDFEDVFSVDADDSLITANQDFTINTGTADFIVDSALWNVTAGGAISATSFTDGTATLTGGSLNGLTGVDATTENTIEATIFDADAESVTGVWEWQDNVAAVFGTDADVSIQYDETTDDRLEITGAEVFFDTGITATGAIDFKGSSAFNIRESANPATSAACTATGELIVDTTDNEIQICTATGVAGAATWVSVSDGGDADTLDTLDSLQFLRSDTSDNYTSGTLTFDSGTELDTAAGSTVDVNGIFNASDSTEFHISEVAGDPNLIGTARACTTVDEIVLDTVSDTIYICTGTGVAGTGTWTTVGNDFNVDTMTWEAEYPDVVVYGDATSGLSHKGKLEALYDVTNSEQYYHWSTNKNEDEEIDLRFRYELPADFVDAGDLTLDYRTLTATAGDNTVQVIVNNDTDSTTCHTDTAAVSVANTWGTLTVTGAEIDTGCSGGNLLAAGDVIEVIIRLIADDTNSGWADVGTMSFAYTN
jgi:hypothetical protein